MMASFPPRRIIVPPGSAAALQAARILARLWNAELSDVATGGSAELIVAGTRDGAGLDRALLDAGTPVLAVPEGAGALKAARILAPWNGRPYAARALRYAGRLARSLRAELRVLHVAPGPLAVDESDPALERRLDGILGTGGDPSWTLRVRSGDAREHILRESGSGRYGLIVLSAHRRPYSSDSLLGSTAARLLRSARVPVLVFPCGRRSRAPAPLAGLSARR